MNEEYYPGGSVTENQQDGIVGRLSPVSSGSPAPCSTTPRINIPSLLALYYSEAAYNLTAIASLLFAVGIVLKFIREVQ